MRVGQVCYWRTPTEATRSTNQTPALIRDNWLLLTQIHWRHPWQTELPAPFLVCNSSHTITKVARKAITASCVIPVPMDTFGMRVAPVLRAAPLLGV